MAERLYVEEVKEGDRIEWCGRWLEVKGVSLSHSGRRLGRRFLVMLDGARRSLHYFDTEMVSVFGFVEVDDVPPAGGVS